MQAASSLGAVPGAMGVLWGGCHVSQACRELWSGVLDGLGDDSGAQLTRAGLTK